MGIVRTGETEYDKEMAKWNTPRNKGGYGPNGYEKYPQMLYKAFKRDTGKVQCMEAPPQSYLYLTLPEFHRAEALAQRFTQDCQLTVRNDQEYDRAKADGWRETPGEAIAHFEAIEREIAQAAAEALHANQAMSDKARAEFTALDAATDAHVVDVVGTKRGRPRAVAPAEA